MTITKGLGTVAGCTAVCGALGGLMGYLIGRFAPGAYSAFFPPRHGQEIDPIQVGLGLGIPQGMLVGVAIGIIIVVIVTWYEIRTREKSD